jgi:threonine dehydratase
VLALEPWECQRGLAAASAGNHGQGVALAGQLAGAPVTVFASEHAVPAKVAAMRALGAEVRLVPGGYGEAEQAGLAFAAAHDQTWVSPYNDGLVIAGQATLGREVMRQVEGWETATWVVPVGGGGLISGIGTVLKAQAGAGARLVGAQSEASPFFHAIWQRGSQAGLKELPSLADGLSGPVAAGSLTIPLVRSFVDEIILVSELEIAQAIAFAWRRYNQRIEGSAAVGLAALLNGAIAARPAIVIISGGNIQPELHADLCS